jgi:Kinase binding protein CGI-121
MHFSMQAWFVMPDSLPSLFQILAPLQVLAAVNRATHDSHYGLMRTKNVHSEIVYALAGTQNVPDSVEL